MLGSAILEVTIGLILLYTVLSMITTAAGELYNMVRRTRGDNLKRWIDDVLGQCEARELYLSGFIPGARATDPASGVSIPRCPSYINDKDFAYGLMCFLACGQSVPDMTQVTVETVCKGCQTRLHHDVEVGRIIPVLAVRAGGDLNKLALEIQQWFNNSQDRVNGWFKREITIVTVITAFLLTFIANADTIGIADKLYTNTNTRQATLSLAQNLTQNPTEPAQPPTPVGAANQPAVANEPAGAKKTDQSALGLLKSLEKTDLLGWRGESAAYFSNFSHNVGRFFMKLFGFILTTLALSLGAPYWFDVLNKLNQTIRTAGVKPEPSTTTK